MFLSPNEQVSVENLLKGIVTLSGNDASVVLAECIAGTEQAFADQMNALAQEARPDQQPFRHRQRLARQGRDLCHRARPRDARPVRRSSTTTSSTRNSTRCRASPGARRSGSDQDITQANRNPILGKVPGADGLKTGHTDEAGYGFTGSAEQNGRRLIEVSPGLRSWNARVQESTRLMQWGFGAWQAKPLFQAGRQGRHGQGPAGQRERGAAGRAAQPRGDRARGPRDRRDRA